MKHISDTKIANAASKLVDKSYALGDMSKGYDCLNYLVSFYSELGVEIPREFEGETLETYPQLWKTNPKKAQQIMAKLFDTFGEEISQDYMARGDLLIFEGKEFAIFPGIYLGNDNVLIVFEEGSHVLPLRFIKKFMTKVRRILNVKKD